MEVSGLAAALKVIVKTVELVGAFADIGGVVMLVDVADDGKPGFSPRGRKWGRRAIRFLPR